MPPPPTDHYCETFMLMVVLYLMAWALWLDQ